jgi:MoxR-like ATPase
MTPPSSAPPGGHASLLPTPDPMPPADLSRLLDVLRENVAGVFLGKPEIIRYAVLALLADGHLLLEDVPGVGKTLLAKAIARSLNCKFSRIQFTPDLLPGDLLGTGVYRQNTGTFEFVPGPVFAQVIVADEINRATPRTQSALLEAMSERQVTTDGVTRQLGPPFLVLATQNPYEFEGTYPLPESQLDRFLMKVKIGYPDRENERRILSQHRVGEPVDKLQHVLSPPEIVALQLAVRNVTVEPPVADYLLDLVDATRVHPDVALGVSTRAALAFYRAVQANALLAGRRHVTPDDVKALAGPVLAHRVLTKGYDASGRSNADAVVADIVAKTRVPV